MRLKFNSILLQAAGLSLSALLASGVASAADVTVNLTAQRTSTVLPDGTIVPMWGYCATGTTCASWTPGPTITVAPTDTLTITLTNNLLTPTSIVILGQVGGGLGTPNYEASPTHAPVGTTTLWANTPVAPGTEFTPPAQGGRARAFAPEAAVGSTGNTQIYSWTKLKPGTYLYETGTHPSIQAPMGLYGLLIVTTPGTPASAGPPAVAATAAMAYPGISYAADAAYLFSEIDPVQNAAVDATAVGLDGSIDESKYPPAVNYSPTYFLVNGQAYDKTLSGSNAIVVASAVAAPSQLLVRLANAGLRTHVPAIVGLSLELVAEDGNLAPGKHKVQNEALLTAGKTYDALVTLPATTGIGSFPLFDRQLSLSTGLQGDGGMQGSLVVGTTAAAALATAKAVPDVFTVNASATTFSGNVLANDIGVHLATLTTFSNGAVTLNADGTFTVTVPAATDWSTVTFQYFGNTDPTLLANVTFKPFGGTASAPTANSDAFSSAHSSTVIQVAHPGVLANDISPLNLALTAVVDPAVTTTCGSLTLNADGSIEASAATPNTDCTFNYFAVNSQGTQSAASAPVTLHFPAATPNLALVVQDASTIDPVTLKHVVIDDYVWTLEEDRTYQPDPSQSAPGPNPNELSVNFHRSYMPLVATGCTGPSSCKATQMINGVAVPARPISRFEDLQLDTSKRYFLSVLPGDAGSGGNGGHTVGATAILPGQTAVVVNVEQQPIPTGSCVVTVFEDNNPTNGALDAENGLGGFQVIVTDARGSTGDAAGQMTYDAFNQPLTNALANRMTPDGLVNLCPITSVPKTAYGDPLAVDTKVGTIFTCPELDSAKNPSPYAGIAVVNHMMQGRFDVTANPSAEREGRGERWIQTATLEGTRQVECFVQAGDPTATANIGFINPANIAKAAAPLNGKNKVIGKITNQRYDRPPSEAIYDSGGREAQAYTTCAVGLSANSGDGESLAYADCKADGSFELTNVPSGSYGLFVFDQYLDQIINLGQVVLVPPSNSANPPPVNLGNVPINMWFGRTEHSAYYDDNGTTSGISNLPITVRFRDGSISNRLLTDSSGQAPQNETFPLPGWFVAESDTTRFKNTKVVVTPDAGGQADAAGPFKGVLSSTETNPMPAALQYPGSTIPVAGKTTRIDPPSVLSEGFQVQTSMTNRIEWYKTQFAAHENGGITGIVNYATTRPFDNPQEEVQLIWQALIANVPVNLYKKTVNGDGSVSLQLVDSGATSSWDAGTASMHCPGQPPASVDPLVTSTLGASTNPNDPLRFKCYDGYHNFNQVQPAQYDGRYRFPAITGTNPTTGKPVAANCSGCTTNPVDGSPMLPAGTYVVEIVPPAGYEVVKEEDKNILIGDAYLDPGTGSQFAGTGQIFILADKATLNAVAGPAKGVKFPACVGNPHVVPDFLTMAPDAQQVAPFAGQKRPLCDRKEVQLVDGMQVPADFNLFTYAPIGGHFAGIMLNDLGATFSKVSPVFGEKAGVPFAPISFRDFAGFEVLRTYSDRWGSFNGMFPAGWEVNPPDPSGYSPIMHLVCMNDPGPIPDPSGAKDVNGNPLMITDPQYDPNFTNFCFPWGALAGVTTYIDNPVLPAAAFAGGYNPADCAYPDATPGIRRVDGDGIEGGATFGPYLSRTGARTLTIKALGTIDVPNPLYGGPSEVDALGAKKTVKRTYSFGATVGSVGLRAKDGTVYALDSVNWGDMQITGHVPSAVRDGRYELVISTAAGRNSGDTVTVWVGGPAPAAYVKAADPALTLTGVGGVLPHPIQDAIDAASPGDLIMLDAGAYHELVLMWKPVKLQGVGAASVVVSGGKKPSKNLQTWQLRVNYLFGLDENGFPIPGVTPKVDLLTGETVPPGTYLGILTGGTSILSRFEGQTITVLGEADGRTALAAAPCRPNDATPCGPTAPFSATFGATIDGITVTAGDAGGGVHVHGWAHSLSISNNRIRGNSGVEGGGIGIGVSNLGSAAPANNAGYGYNRNVDIHNNMISSNGTLEANVGLGSVSPGGGIAICTGADNYRVNYNFICGNFSQNDGGGIGHSGPSKDGVIANNSILFNQTYNPTWATHGGGITVMPESGTTTLGIGSVRIDSNLILGNFAQAGNGGGIRVQESNRDVVTIINNMISNNVAGYAGAGISLADALEVRITNNTVASNDSVALLGGLFSTTVNGVSTGPNRSVANPAGISTELTSATLLASLPQNQRNANVVSQPKRFVNNVIWHNRSFFLDQTGTDPVLRPSNNWRDSLPNTAKPAILADQTTTGQCTPTAAYWDLGVVGDQNVGNGAAAQRLRPTYSVLSESLSNVRPYSNGSANDPNDNHNVFTDPGLASVYCNGARRAPELAADPNQPNRFMLANVGDEGGNSLDLRYGPLSLLNEFQTLNGGAAVFNGNYHILLTGSAFNRGTDDNAPRYDFDGDTRPQAGAYDIGADEIAVGLTGAGFGRVRVGTTGAAGVFTLTNGSGTGFTIGGGTPFVVSAGFVLGAAGVNACTAGQVLGAGQSCTIAVQAKPNKTGNLVGNLTVTTSTGVKITAALSVTGFN